MNFIKRFTKDMNHQDIKILSYIVGVAFSDGSVKKKDNRIVLRVRDQPFAKKFASALRKLSLRPLEGIERGSFRVAVTSKTLHDFLLEVEKRKTIDGLDPLFLFEGLYEGDGYFGLKNEKYIVVKISMKRKRKKWILEEVVRKLNKEKIKAHVYDSKSGRKTLLIRERYSIFKLFNKIDPIIRNPKRLLLSYHHERTLKKRGILEEYKKKFKERWKEMERNWKIVNMNGKEILKILLSKPSSLRKAINDRKVRRKVIPFLGSIWTQTGITKLLFLSESTVDGYVQKFSKRLPAEYLDSQLRNMIIRLTKEYGLFNYIKKELRTEIVIFLAKKYRNAKKVATILGTNTHGIYNYGNGIWSEIRRKENQLSHSSIQERA